jgi:hypothetical protein
MRIEAHQVPDRRLGDHWRVIVMNRVPFEMLQLRVTGPLQSYTNLCT